MLEQTGLTSQRICSPEMTEVLLRELMALTELTELPQLVQTISCIESKDAPLANDLFDLCNQVVLPRLELSCEELVDTLRRITLKRDQANRRKPIVVTIEQAEILNKADQQEDKDVETAVKSNTSLSQPISSAYESGSEFKPAEVEDSYNLKTTYDVNYSEINSIGIQRTNRHSYVMVVHSNKLWSKCNSSSLGNHPSQHSPQRSSAAVDANQLANPCERKEDKRVKLTLEMHDKAIYIKADSQNMKISLD
ncbi:hypothetical protein M513_10374 [Trichuris suis]|uniref:Uncharacterized protein n=1 Tax=Trichuris suis TaxID=68888 RepID=A0A085LUU8_9BILA|nr:hypothetical protein M513_10374 [Trichuris suis]